VGTLDDILDRMRQDGHEKEDLQGFCTLLLAQASTEEEDKFKAWVLQSFGVDLGGDSLIDLPREWSVEQLRLIAKQLWDAMSGDKAAPVAEQLSDKLKKRAPSS